MDYRRHFSTTKTPQSKPIPGSSQVANSAGGYAWAVDDWVRLERFLVLGTEGGTYYINEGDLTTQNAQAVLRCIQADGERVVKTIVEISFGGRAAKNDPALFALAMAAKLGNTLETRRAAFAALPKVARIGTHLFHFAHYMEGFGGWGRGTKRAFADWYNAKSAQKLAYQLVKYQQRDGWSHRDLLRLAKPAPASNAHDALYRYVTKGDRIPEGLIAGVEAAKKADVKTLVGLIREFGLPRECIPTEHLNDAKIWEALLENMPMTAMIRNLGKMSAVGLLKPMSSATKTVCERLADGDRLRKTRVHPIQILAALKTYERGAGFKGNLSWAPVAKIVDSLDGAFYKTFQSVEPAGKRTLLALDVSGSMGSPVSALPIMSCREASAAMALVTAATEEMHQFVAFTSSSGSWSRYDSALKELSISPRQRLDDVVSAISGLPFGGTDCSLPMVWATQNKVEVDTFVIYTDNETWEGKVHPAQALNFYRQKMGIPAKLVVVAMEADPFSIADPNDAGMLDVVGFDTNTPLVLNDFSRH
jgi:60 kDa SS-A/Ro ribonucleoprotein